GGGTFHSLRSPRHEPGRSLRCAGRSAVALACVVEDCEIELPQSIHAKSVGTVPNGIVQGMASGVRWRGEEGGGCFTRHAPKAETVRRTQRLMRMDDAGPGNDRSPPGHMRASSTHRRPGYPLVRLRPRSACLRFTGQRKVQAEVRLRAMRVSTDMVL